MEGALTDQASILVVDDNPLIVNVLKSLLGSEHYQVYTSTNGKEALDVLGNKFIDVIICDVMMPKMDGYELHYLVRKRSEFSHIPFVFLTALGEQLDICRGKEAGADDYLVKPFEPHQLLSIVKGKVARSRALKTHAEERFDNYRKRVVHTLSHEFRTPLVAIKTGTELLLEQADQVDQKMLKNMLEAIHRGGTRLERLVTDFMLLQQIEAGIATKLFEKRAGLHAVGQTVQNFVDAKRNDLESTGFSLSFEDLSQNLEVWVYEPQIHDVLGRIMDNAVKFSQDKKEIEIVSYLEDGEIIIDVRDRGIGLDLSKMKEATDVFGQIDRDKLEQQGGGLGLAIACRYIAINQGRIEFENRKGGGSIVRIVLPVPVGKKT